MHRSNPVGAGVVWSGVGTLVVARRALPTNGQGFYVVASSGTSSNNAVGGTPNAFANRTSVVVETST
jgi:hypothetical protein